MAEQAIEDSDDDFDRLSDFSGLSLSDAETDNQDAPQNTPATTPPSSSFQQELPRHRQKRFVCTYENCSKAFNRPVRLEEHLRSHTNERTFKCQYEGCSKTYLRDSHLKHHVKSAHTKVRDYKCTWEGCDKGFATGSRLKNHLASHEGHEKFRCRGFGVCRQTFRKKDTLQRHIVSVHLGAKPFPCPESDCTKAFHTAEHLRHHQRVNHDPHRYSCDICLESVEEDQLLSDLGKRQKRGEAYFANWTNFQIHNQEVHPPTCDHCNQAFQTNKQLTRHLELKHDYRTLIKMAQPAASTMFPCDHEACDKIFASAKALKSHKLRHTLDEDRGFHCTGAMRVYEVSPHGLGFLDAGEEAPNNAKVHVVKGCDEAAFNYRYALVNHIRSKKHLNIDTRVAARNRKKRAAKAAELTDGDDDKEEKKTRKATKDKRTNKKKVESGITGTADETLEALRFNLSPTGSDVDSTDDLLAMAKSTPFFAPATAGAASPFAPASPPSGYPPLSPPFPVYSGREVEFLGDPAPLTGSETMVEGEVFGGYGSGFGFVNPDDLHYRRL